MKLQKLFLLPLLLLALGSCDESTSGDGPENGVIWDIYPYAINIAVSDAAGNDLLDPAAENSIAHNGIKAIWNGQTFEKDSLPDFAQTKALNVVFRGLQSFQLSDGRYVLSFGEFRGDASREASDLVIDWNDGTPKDTISFSHSFWWENSEPQQETRLYLNGQETEAPVQIVKP